MQVAVSVQPIEKAVLRDAVSKLALKPTNEILRNIVKRVQSERKTLNTAYSRMHHRHSRT
jgi:hypothetical protein